MNMANHQTKMFLTLASSNQPPRTFRMAVAYARFDVFVYGGGCCIYIGGLSTCRFDVDVCTIYDGSLNRLPKPMISPHAK